MPRSLGFYFGSVIFFIGVLMMAVGISKVIGKTLDLMALVELISGVVLIIIGSRAIRSVKSSDDFSAKSKDKQLKRIWQTLKSLFGKG